VLDVALQGVPWVVPFVIAIIVAWSWLLAGPAWVVTSTRSAPVRKRPAGPDQCGLDTHFRVHTRGLTAGFAGLVYESRLGSISVGFDGGTYVLYAVAALSSEEPA